MRLVALFLLLLSLEAGARAQEYRAGVARVSITPELPAWLSGYAARTVPADAVTMDLWAKALALDDGRGGRIVIVTTDLIGLPAEITDPVATEAQKRYKLKRDQIVFNSSHTHSGPIVPPTLMVMAELAPADEQRTLAYGRRLEAALTEVIGKALANLAPARLSFGQGEAGFAINRRVAKFPNAPAPVEHSVPVLRVDAPDGTLRVVLFGYACHNTTLTAEFHQVSGDYAGYAQLALEKSHPGATAMFLMLCGADQNPNPRSKPELPRQHGEALADAVSGILGGRMTPVSGRLRTAYERISLPFAAHTKEQYEKESADQDVFKTRRARLMLKAYASGKPVRETAYPVQAAAFGRDLAIVFLGGEVVVDYDLRAKKEHPGVPLVVAGYSNAVMGYIPSLRVLREGGYEGGEAMIYYGQPGPFTEDVEDRIFGAIGKVLTRTGVH